MRLSPPSPAAQGKGSKVKHLAPPGYLSANLPFLHANLAFLRAAGEGARRAEGGSFCESASHVCGVLHFVRLSHCSPPSGCRHLPPLRRGRAPN